MRAMRRLTFALVLCASLPSAAGEPSEEKLAGSVLVWHDAMFYVEADDSKGQFQLAQLPGPRKESVGYVVPMRVVGTKDDFVEVEAGPYDCAWTRLPAPDDLARLRLFVKRTDLAPVVKQGHWKTYPNNTGVVVQPGLPVSPDGPGRYRVPVEGVALGVLIPPANVGLSYRFYGGAVKSKAAKYQIVNRTPITIANVTVELPAPLPVNTFTKGKETSSISIRSSCVDVRFSVPNAAVIEAMAGSGTGFKSVVKPIKAAERWLLPKGTPMFSPSMKHQVAVTSRDVEVGKPEGNTNVCFARSIGFEHPDGSLLRSKAPSGNPKLMVCAPATAVKHVN
jgi:hypothetical protein